MNMPTAHGPARDGIATGDVSEEEEDAFASDSGEDDAGVNDPDASVAMAGRACDEKYMKLGRCTPGSGVCIDCHKNKSQKHVPTAAYGMPTVEPHGTLGAATVLRHV